MATGDQNDFVSRLKRLLPLSWFPDVTPVLDGLMAGLASAFATAYGNVQFLIAQSRIATATGEWLDIAAQDFFAGNLVRKPGQTDAALSARIRAAIIAPKATRAALAGAVSGLTGRAPLIFEPAQPADTGGIGYLGMTVGTGLEIAGAGVAGAGGYGSIALPFQCFVTAYRAKGGGIPSVMGYYTGSGWAGGGIGSLATPSAAGAIEVAALSFSMGQITDADIYGTIAGVMPAATIAWTRITN